VAAPRPARRSRGGGDGVLLLGVIRIDRAAGEVPADLRLHCGVGAAAGAAELVQRPQVQRAVLAGVTSPTGQAPILRVTPAGGGAGEANQRERLAGAHRVVLADTVGQQGDMASKVKVPTVGELKPA